MAIKSSSYQDELIGSLVDPDEAAHYVAAALDDSLESFLMSLRDVAQASTMAKVAEEANVKRESLYRMLSAKGNPTLESLSGVLAAVGLRFTVTTLVNQSHESVEIPEKVSDIKATPCIEERMLDSMVNTVFQRQGTNVTVPNPDIHFDFGWRNQDDYLGVSGQNTYPSRQSNMATWSYIGEEDVLTH